MVYENIEKDFIGSSSDTRWLGLLILAGTFLGFLVFSAIMGIPLLIVGLILLGFGLFLLVIVGAPVAILVLILKGVQWMEKELEEVKKHKKKRR